MFNRHFGRVVVACSVAVVLTVSLGAEPPAPQQPSGATPTIESRTAGLRKIDGFFPLYYDERSGAMLLEIPRIDSEFLFSTGLSAGLGSNDIGLDRGAGGVGRIVTFQRAGPKVMLVQPNQSFRSSSANALERRSVEDSFAKSILWGFTVAAETGRPRARRRHDVLPPRRDGRSRRR